jgi:membrane associated rhomboid family serine protease
MMVVLTRVFGHSYIDGVGYGVIQSILDDKMTAAGLLALLFALKLVATTISLGCGASGGIFGLLLCYGMAFPHRRLMLIFPPIPMPAWLFVTLYGLLELYLGVSGSERGVAHFAHLGGMAAGYAMIRYWRGRAVRRIS